MGERCVRNAEVRGSIPLGSTTPAARHATKRRILNLGGDVKTDATHTLPISALISGHAATTPRTNDQSEP